MSEKDWFLPQEIIFKIFLYLPGSSLIKFQTLSKSIRSLIRSRYFIESQLNHASTSTKPPIILLFYSNYISLVETKTWTVTNNLSLNPSYKERRFGGSCNGLICLYDDSSRVVSVINPTTREYLTPPRPSNLLQYGLFSYTIGFVSSSKEYKLVYLCMNEGELHLEVCCIGDKSWKQVAIGNCPLSRFNGELFPCGVLSHGALFWLVFGSYNKVWLIRFDLKEEKVTCINLNIEPFDRKSNDFILGELGGELCLTIMPDFVFPKEKEMHLLIFDGKSDFSQKMKLMVPRHSYMMPLFISGEKILLQDQCFDAGLYYYDLSNCSCEKVFVADYDFCYSAHPHIDSLVSFGGARAHYVL